MSKKILVISTSPRKGGNSDLLADEFIRGAREAGCEVEKVCLREMSLSFCRGCLACLKTGRCVIRDDAAELALKMGEADALAFATPVYYFGMSGQMKTMLDRANPLFEADYRFRDVYLLAAAAEDEPDTVNGTREGLEYWLSCFERAHLAGVVFAGGVTEPGAVKGHKAMGESYELGRSVNG